MVLPTTGNRISLFDVQTEFGGTPPIYMSEYYGITSGVPSSGQIGLSSTFGGKSLTTSVSSSPVVSWIAKIESTSGTARLTTCNALSDGSIVVGGHYTTTSVSFYNANGSLFRTLTAGGAGGFFVARLNSSGTFLWATRVEGYTPNLNFLYSSCTLADNSTFIAIGSGTVTASIKTYDGNDANMLTPNNSTAARPYIVRYTSSSTPNVIRNVGGAASRAQTMSTLSNGNFVYGVAVTTNTGSYNLFYPNGVSLGVSFSFNSGNTSGGATFFLICASNVTGVWYMSFSQLSTDRFAWRTSNGVASGFVAAMTSNSTSTIRNADGTTTTMPAPLSNYDGYIVLISNTGID